MIRLNNIEVKFGDFTALHDINVHVEEGQFYTFLGPSGCGKTTTLRTITGFNIPSKGQVIVKGKDITSLPVEKRNIGMVFQNYALFPTMSVYENIAFGLRVQKIEKSDIDKRVREMAKKVELNDQQLMRKVAELSGGQQQRVALARTLNQNPSIILADEPVAALDPVTAHQVMADFKRINEEMGITILINIHHVDLALGYAQRVVGIRAGEIVYDGPSSEVTQEILDSIYNGSAVPQAGGN